MYFLDANICIYFLKSLYSQLNKKLTSIPPSKIKIPSMVKAEILVGVEKGARQITRKLWEIFFEVIPFGDPAVKQYAAIRAYLEKHGESIGPDDLIIAATTLAHNGILITHNANEFSRIPNFTIEDWTA
jgi:tRNA(fMet)-specific endonuclease VapC